MREGASGKVEGKSMAISDNLYDVGIIELSKVCDGIGSSNHFEAGLIFQRFCQGVDKGW